MAVLMAVLLAVPLAIVTMTTNLARLTSTCLPTPRRSVLAIAALVIAMYSQWVWADPAVGIIGSLVIASWAFGLIRDSGAVLLDVSVDKNLEAVIRDRLETRGDRVTDLPSVAGRSGHRAAVISVISDTRCLRRPTSAVSTACGFEPRDDRGRALSASADALSFVSLRPVVR